MTYCRKHLCVSILIILFSFLSDAVYAQYFYKDIWNNKQLAKDFQSIKNANLKTVSIKSFENDGSSSEGFSCQQKFDRNYTRSEMISVSNITGASILTSFYDIKGNLTRLTDSSASSTSRTEFEYDTSGNIKKISLLTKADDEPSGISESREYFYNAAGKPEKMIRKKMGKDYSVTGFVLDEKGNIAEENEIVNGKSFAKFYYYYDDKNRLTDVVRYNSRSNRLLPDYMFEYNTAGQLKQMITTEAGSSNYSIWRYTYNDFRLRETEKCYSKQKRLVGSIEYEYK